MSGSPETGFRTPPRALVRAFWALHRATYRLSAGRLGLWRPKAGRRFGVMLLETKGRRTGEPRTAIIGYFEDGPNLVTIAMNGWATAEPTWWLNLKAQPDTTVHTARGRWTVSARAAEDEERERLWARAADFPGWGQDIDALAARRQRPTVVVVFEPRESAFSEDADVSTHSGHETLAETSQ